MPCFYFFCFGFGPLLLLIGLLLLLGTTDDRALALQKYHDSVENWNALRHTFDNHSFVIQQDSDYPYPQQLLLSTEDDDRQLQDKASISLETYKPLLYVAGEAPHPVGSLGYMIKMDAKVSLRVKGISPLNTRTIHLQHCRSAPCDQRDENDRLECESYQSCEADCYQRNGSFMGGSRCQFVVFLKRACVLLAPTEDGGWQFAQPNMKEADGWQFAQPNMKNAGCYYETKHTADDVGAFHPATYTLDRVHSVRLEIRHAADPVVFASYLTKGTYNFGQSLAEKLVPAFVFLTSGFLWSISVVSLACCAVKRVGRHDEGLRYESIPDYPACSPDNISYPGRRLTSQQTLSEPYQSS